MAAPGGEDKFLPFFNFFIELGVLPVYRVINARARTVK